MPGEISVNRKAFGDYHILEKFEAGLELKGTEVKAIRAGLANINNAFARVDNGQLWLFQADVQPYGYASHEQHEPKRQRRLLLHKKEIDHLADEVAIKGCTLVALRMYWKEHRVKIEIGVGKGKEARDKRQDLKQRAINRETDREISRFNRKHG